jgi:hypothetical protein
VAELLILIGLVVVRRLQYRGASTGVAFGPAVGSRIVRKVTAGALFAVFAFLGAWTIGRNVITTMSSEIVDAAVFTPAASVGVLFFAGLALLISNLYGVPASTSMTAVGTISVGGFTIARRTLATVGNDVTDLPILAALIVSTVGRRSSIGLGWGRASRARTLAEIATPPPTEEPGTEATTGALKAPPAEDDEEVAASPTVGEIAEGEVPDPDKQQVSRDQVPGIGEEDPEELSAESLFDPAATARTVALWVITPTISVLGAYLLFSFLA